MKRDCAIKLLQKLPVDTIIKAWDPETENFESITAMYLTYHNGQPVAEIETKEC